MELRTTFNIAPSYDKISYDDCVMFIGSCFASSMGSQMLMGRMPVMINPSGAVFNPVSVCNTLNTIAEDKDLDIDNLYCHNGTYLSFNHYTDFSSDDPAKVLEKIDRRSKEALTFLKQAKYLFVTFGTARVYRWKKTGQIVSNCHKISADQFDTELLSVAGIVKMWKEQLEKLKSLFPQLKVIFTISPVRHWKDGAHGNQVSKSVLFLAVEELLEHSVHPGYFPAYELVMDDLRDYRFYCDDMLHPSTTAISYIWEAFSDCYLEKKTLILWKDVLKISKACQHRISIGSKSRLNEFATKMLSQISDLEKRISHIDFSNEKYYFNNLIR